MLQLQGDEVLRVVTVSSWALLRDRAGTTKFRRRAMERWLASTSSAILRFFDCRSGCRSSYRFLLCGYLQHAPWRNWLYQNLSSFAHSWGLLLCLRPYDAGCSWLYLSCFRLIVLRSIYRICNSISGHSLWLILGTVRVCAADF